MFSHLRRQAGNVSSKISQVAIITQGPNILSTDVDETSIQRVVTCNVSLYTLFSTGIYVESTVIKGNEGILQGATSFSQNDPEQDHFQGHFVRCCYA